MNSILIVDDVEDNRIILKEILDKEYETLEAENGEKALEVLRRADKLPRVVLLDVAMPGMDGFEVLKKMKENPDTEAIPVLFIDEAGTDSSEVRGLNEGAADYIVKPFDPESVKARVKNFMRQMSEREKLQEQLKTKTYDLIKTYERTLEALATIIEYRSLESGRHVRRTRKLMEIMINRLFTDPKYRDEMDAEFCRYSVRAISLHDIGKIGIPDEILFKPGKLTQDEFEIVKKHTVIGSEIIDNIAQNATDGLRFLGISRDICRSHHERWDGLGYPDNLKREEIPLAARIAAIIDVYDALTSVRCYKDACSHEEAFNILREGGGTQFDPHILEEFLAASDEILETGN